MSEAPDIPTAWQWFLEGRPGTRYGGYEGLRVFGRAAYAEPRLRTLYPFPSHGTVHFVRGAPPWPTSGHDDLPFVAYGGPPYTVYASGYAEILGEPTTPEEAVALVVAHLPADVGQD